MKELWKPIPNYEECYEVSNLGNVRGKDRLVGHRCKGHFRKIKGKIKNQRLSIWGYPVVDLKKDGIQNTKSVHSLVMLAFYGPRPDGYVVDHKNGVRTDNRLENLEYVTNRENLMRALSEEGKNHHVSFYKDHWRVRIRNNGKRYYASAKSLETALEKRDKILKQHNIVVSGFKNDNTCSK